MSALGACRDWSVLFGLGRHEREDLVVGGERPAGTVTFLFTDIEGSTQLWERDTDGMAEIVARHDELVGEVTAGHDGYVFAAGGDGFAVAFGRPDAALAAAVELQQRVSREEWPHRSSLRIRVGVHSGAAEQRDGNYFGSAVNRAARISAITNGGHVVVSSTTAALLVDADVELVDLGEHSLLGLQRREHLFGVPGMPGWSVQAPLRVSARSGNLPAERVRLIGRRREVDDVRRLVRPSALVTVVGVGGVGKTRLAIAVAAAEGPQFSDGCWLVELGQVVSANDVPAAVAQALGLHLASGRGSAIAAALEGQHRLVVLDNCEHVLDAVADLVDAILARAGTIALVATSREALGVDGEHLVPLRPMSLSTTGARSEAAQLFVERGDAVLGHYEPNAAEELEIEELCGRLDGLPLAIELAAARMPTMTLAELSDNVADRLRLLTRRRGAVARHQSLRAAIAWSYDLLTVDEQHLFDLLSVFAGDFDLAAANAIVDDAHLEGTVSDLVRSLVDKSLLTAAATPAGTRFSQLETLRQFAEERLGDRGETITTRDRHMQHFVAWAARADAGVQGADEPGWHRRLLTEWHNLRNALSWAAETDDGDAGCRLVTSISWWAASRGLTELADWALLALSLPSNADHRLRPLMAANASGVSMFRGDLTVGAELAALAWSEEERLGDHSAPQVPIICAIAEGLRNGPEAAVAMRREGVRRAVAHGDEFLQLSSACAVEHDYIDVVINAGNLEQIAAAAASTEALVAAAGRLQNPTLVAWSTAIFGALLARCEPSVGVAHLQRALDVANTVDARIAADLAVAHLARTHTRNDRPVDALVGLEPGIEHYRRSGALGQAMWLTIEALGALRALGHPDVVALLLGRDDVIAGFQLRGWSDEGLREELRGQLGRAEAQRLFDDGTKLTGPAAVLLALDSIQRHTHIESPPVDSH